PPTAILPSSGTSTAARPARSRRGRRWPAGPPVPSSGSDRDATSPPTRKPSPPLKNPVAPSARGTLTGTPRATAWPHDPARARANLDAPAHRGLGKDRRASPAGERELGAGAEGRVEEKTRRMQVIELRAEIVLTEQYGQSVLERVLL